VYRVEFGFGNDGGHEELPESGYLKRERQKKVSEGKGYHGTLVCGI
jgi:hypothetical protein